MVPCKAKNKRAIPQKRSTKKTESSNITLVPPGGFSRGSTKNQIVHEPECFCQASDMPFDAMFFVQICCVRCDVAMRCITSLPSLIVTHKPLHPVYRKPTGVSKNI